MVVVVVVDVFVVVADVYVVFAMSHFVFDAVFAIPLMMWDENNALYNLNVSYFSHW